MKIRAISAILIISIISLTGCAEKGAKPQMDIGRTTVEKVQVDDIEIAYKVTGKGSPLILIVGSSSTMEMWSPALIAGLAQNHQVIVFDNRGMGLTSSSGKEFSIKLFADDVAGLMSALNIKKADILGWSMGSYVAQELALNYPDKVNKVILYAADAGGDKAIHIPDSIKQLTDTSGTERERGERLLRLIFPAEWLKANPDPRKYMPVPTTPVLPDSVKRQNSAIEKWTGTYDRLSTIKSPVLLVTGTDDVIVPPQNAIMLADRIPNAWLIQIKGGGHGLMYQYPEKLIDIADLFLSSD